MLKVGLETSKVGRLVRRSLRRRDRPGTQPLNCHAGNIEYYTLVSPATSLLQRHSRAEVVKLFPYCVLNQRVLSSGAAARLRGRLLHLSSTMPSRLGRASLPFLNEIADGKSDSWSAGLARDLHFALSSLERPHRIEVSLVADASPPAIAYTDASYQSGSVGPVPRMCAILFNAASRHGVVTCVPRTTSVNFMNGKPMSGPWRC